jgi:hypothetical protein
MRYCKSSGRNGAFLPLRFEDAARPGAGSIPASSIPRSPVILKGLLGRTCGRFSGLEGELSEGGGGAEGRRATQPRSQSPCGAPVRRRQGSKGCARSEGQGRRRRPRSGAQAAKRPERLGAREHAARLPKRQRRSACLVPPSVPTASMSGAWPRGRGHSVDHPSGHPHVLPRTRFFFALVFIMCPQCAPLVSLAQSDARLRDGTIQLLHRALSRPG